MVSFQREKTDRTYFKATIFIHPDFQKQDNLKIQINNNEINVGTNLAPSWNQVRDQVGDQVGDQVIDRIVKISDFCKKPKSRKEILDYLELSNRSSNFKDNIKPAIEAGLLEMTIPNKPNSPNQRYRTTEKGIQLL